MKEAYVQTNDPSVRLSKAPSPRPMESDNASRTPSGDNPSLTQVMICKDPSPWPSDKPTVKP